MRYEGRGSDLHAHSDRSDGTHTPSSLAARAREAGLKRLALTDHDTLEGWPAFEEAARAFGVEPIPGVELTSYVEEGREIHILGLFVDPSNRALQERLSEFRRIRDGRIRAMVGKLRIAGLSVTEEEVFAAAGPAGRAAIGRPHLAEALVKRGYALSIPEAFQKYLVRGAPGYVAKAKIAPAEAVALVRGAGGVPVWAHPGASLSEVQARLPSLLAAGIAGMEVHYAAYDEAHRAALGALARERGLLASGGSDFHGERKKGVSLGAARVPEEDYLALASAAGRRTL